MSLKPRPGYGFPEAPKQKTTQPCVIITNDIIVALYNGVHREQRALKNVNKQVKAWFTAASKQAGWSQVKWYPEYDRARGLAALLVYKHQDPNE